MFRRADSSAAYENLMIGGRKENIRPDWAERSFEGNPNPDPRLKPRTPTIAPSSSAPPNSTIHLRDLNARIPLQKEVKFSRDDWKTLRNEFPQANCIQYSYPFIIICGVNPPVKPIAFKSLIMEFYNDIDEFLYCPGVGANPRIRDPLPHWPEMPDRRLDTFASIKYARTSLSDALGIKICAMSTFLHLLIAEVEERDYDLDALPGIVAGRITLWIVYGTAWENNVAHLRMNDPGRPTGDDTDYRPVGLCPGIKVYGMKKSTSGVLRNERTGEVALSVSCHGWDHHDNLVHHPNPNSSPIATIHTRVPENDLSLARLAPDVIYTNRTYFDGPIPQKLASEELVQEHGRVFSYYGADGFTTGLCWLQLMGFRNIDDSVRVGQYSGLNSYIMRQTRASADEANMAKEDICGAPLVHQESDDTDISNACVGFFWKYERTNAVIPTLDYLIDQGWGIV